MPKCRQCSRDYTYDDEVGYSTELCGPLCDGIEFGKRQSEKRIDELQAAMREIYEVWAGSEECDALTATEAYQHILIHEMRDIAAKFLAGDQQH